METPTSTGTSVAATPPPTRVVEAGEIEMASRLRLAVTRLHRRLRQESAGALAARESVQPPSMTRIVGALEEMGHVSRVVDPSDRRVARVTVTPQGGEVLERGRSIKNAFLADQLRRMAPGERQSLGELTVLLERLLALDEP
jgi:DNA-binding MarR family transcriptional regulator